MIKKSVRSLISKKLISNIKFYDIIDYNATKYCLYQKEF